MTSSSTYSLVKLTIEGEMPFLQLLDGQNVYKKLLKIHVSVQTRVTGNSNSLFKMVELL